MRTFKLPLALLFAVFASGLAATSFAVTFTVNSIFDVVAAPPLDNGVCETAPGNGVCTLRAAVMKANHFPGGGATINIPAGTYTLSIAYGPPFDETTGSLKITQTATIAGAGMDTTFVDGGALDNVFGIGAGPVSMSNMTVQNGKCNCSGAGILDLAELTISGIHITNNLGTEGGGIAVEQPGTAVINDSLIDENVAGFGGGGVYVYSATLTINHSAIINNNAGEGLGGGLFAQYFLGVPGTTIIDTTVSGNRASSGGGIYVEGNAGVGVTLNRSDISANAATQEGGGIGVGSDTPLTMNNSTISANSAQDFGGGILNNGTASLFHVTIAGNVSDSDNNGGGGGAFYNRGSLSVWNSLLAENFAATLRQDCGFTTAPVSEDYNYSQTACGFTGTTTHNLTSGDPLLGPRQNNGGATPTRALFVGSVALDQIPPGLCRDSFGAAPTTDQRSVQRPVNGLCDMGAFEGSVPLPLFNANLIRNGDAEDGGGSMTGAFVGSPHWTVGAGQFTVIPYGAPGGFPTVGTDVIPATHGYNFFAGGAAPSSEASQTIALTAGSALIDTGTVKYVLSGDFGGFGTDDDSAQMSISFLDSGHTPIGSPVSIGNYDAAFRNNKTGLFPASASGGVPVGTRFVQVNVTMTRVSGVYNDGYADNLSLVLTAGAPPALQSAVSRRIHGAAGTFDLPLSLADVHNPTTEPRTGPAQTIVFSFDKPVNAATATITEGTATAAVPTFSGNNVIVGLTGVANQQYVTVSLTNVGAVDGGTGGVGSARVGFLAGDVNQNRVVSLADLGLVNAQLAQVVTAANYLKDVNASGTLSVADKAIANANLTKALPAP